MSHRGSKSADFIGDFKRYDYALNVSPDSLNVPNANLIIDFLTRLSKDSVKLSKLHRQDVITELTEIKSFMKIIKNDSFNKRLNAIIYEREQLGLVDLRKEYKKIKTDVVEFLLKKYDNIFKNYRKSWPEEDGKNPASH